MSRAARRSIGVRERKRKTDVVAKRITMLYLEGFSASTISSVTGKSLPFVERCISVMDDYAEREWGGRPEPPEAA